MNTITNLIGTIILIITLVYMMKERQRVPEGQTVQDLLTVKEKISMWILCLLNPLIAGAVFYYGWKKRLPVKAKQANGISLWAFLLELLSGITLLAFNPVLAKAIFGLT